MQGMLMLERDQAMLSYARPLFSYACEAGVDMACANLGSVIASPANATKKDVADGLAMIRKSCSETHPPACTIFGSVVHHKREVEYFGDALSVLARGCDWGDQGACYDLSLSYDTGSFGVTDQWKAANIAARSCEHGDWASCNALGYMFINGHGFPKDEFKGATLFYSACASGYAPACDSFGEALDKGWGFGPDHDRAFKFYEYACRVGHQKACARAVRPLHYNSDHLH
jgi:TPR repeat protein